jgi:hypothetical protein
MPSPPLTVRCRPALVQGAYPSLTQLPPPPRTLWRIRSDGSGAPEKIDQGMPAYLMLDNGFVYWTT